jgi:tRNA pseudouridine synthase 10
MSVDDVIGRAEKALLKYPLCDHCLGRLFAKMGRELGNEERGRALKTLLSMVYDLKLRAASEGGVKGELYTLAKHGGEPLTRLYKRVYGEDVAVDKCYICGGLLSRSLFNELAERVSSYLRDLDASTFLVGVKLEQSVLEHELEVARAVGFDYSESIKNEVKREVGKRVAQITGLQPSFTNPDVVAIIHIPSLYVELEVKPVYLRGYYVKTGRNISHTPWITRDGAKKYPLSIQEFVDSRLRGLFKADAVLIHAAGREDVDARMVGTGRPLVIEVVRPRRRKIDLSELNSLLEGGVVTVRLEGYAQPRDKRVVKENLGKKAKVYKVLVLLGEEVGEDKLRQLEDFFQDRVVTQRTPTRVLRRKKDIARRRKVYSVKVASAKGRLVEALIYCESGLYVKELVHCDNGRTDPCFAGVLGVQAVPLELDVLGFAGRPGLDF